MRKELIVLQDGFKDCGSACLLSIIRYYGGDIPLSSLVELTNTTSKLIIFILKIYLINISFTIF